MGAKVQITGNGVTTKTKLLQLEIVKQLQYHALPRPVCINNSNTPGGETSDQITKSARIPVVSLLSLSLLL